MESFLARYRNITVLLLVIFAQLVLLAVQVKNDRDVPKIRVWTVTAVMPIAHVVELVRGGAFGLIRRYILLRDEDAENRRLKDELGRYKIENTFLKNQLNTAERAKALQIFQASTPSKTLAANVIGIGAGSNSKVVYVNRGSIAGVERGMAVVTPDGIVGKVIAAYPMQAMVMLATDPEFAAGVIGQRSQARGTMKGQGTPTCKVDYVPADQKVEVGEMFYTSGDDRIFPRGFPAGVVREVRKGSPFQEIYIDPVGLQHGVEDVLILIEGVHQDIPDAPPANQPVYIAPAPPSTGTAAAAPQGTAAPVGTEADKLRTEYKALGDAENHVYGEGGPGAKPPDFTKLGAGGAPAPGKPAATPGMPAGTPAGSSAAPPKPVQSAPAGNVPPGSPAQAKPAAGGQSGGGQSPVSRPAQPPAGGANAKPPESKPVTNPQGGGQSPAAKPAQSTAPGAAPAKQRTDEKGGGDRTNPAKPSDAMRRNNQSGGAPPGGHFQQ